MNLLRNKTALDAAAQCAADSGCGGFIMRGNTDFALMPSENTSMTAAPIEFTTYVARVKDTIQGEKNIIIEKKKYVMLKTNGRKYLLSSTR